MSTNVNACRYCGALPGAVHKGICPMTGVVRGLSSNAAPDKNNSSAPGAATKYREQIAAVAHQFALPPLERGELALAIAGLLDDALATQPPAERAQGVGLTLTDEEIDAVWNGIDGKKVIAGENQMNWNRALRRAFARAILARQNAPMPVAGCPDLSDDTPPDLLQRNVRAQVARRAVAAPMPERVGVPDVAAMVNRFLSWPLPKTFLPDCGISFDGRKDDEWNKNKTWPIGTNLLTADEARQMFEYVLAAAPSPQEGKALDHYMEASIALDAATDNFYGQEGKAVEGAELWKRLIADTSAEPCKYPCLRDDLHDWLAQQASSQVDTPEGGAA